MQGACTLTKPDHVEFQHNAYAVQCLSPGHGYGSCGLRLEQLGVRSECEGLSVQPADCPAYSYDNMRTWMLCMMVATETPLYACSDRAAGLQIRHAQCLEP